MRTARQKLVMGFTLIMLLVSTGCAQGYEKPIGKWYFPIRYNVADNCPEFLHVEAAKGKEMSPVDYSMAEDDRNFQIFCSDHIPPNWGYLQNHGINGAAHTNTIGNLVLSCDMWISPRRLFYTTEHNVEMVKSTFWHEFGHCMGMGHSSLTDSVMAPSSGRRPKSWSQRDRDELNRIYGLPLTTFRR